MRLCHTVSASDEIAPGGNAVLHTLSLAGVAAFGNLKVSPG